MLTAVFLYSAVFKEYIEEKALTGNQSNFVKFESEKDLRPFSFPVTYKNVPGRYYRLE